MTRFVFSFARAYRLAALPFGVTASTAYVEVDERDLRVRFGPWSLRTALDNVAGTTATGGFAFLKTAGPPHLSFADRGITFATSSGPALCVRFHDPVPAIEPTGRLRHPAATLTLADTDGFAARLGAATPGAGR